MFPVIELLRGEPGFEIGIFCLCSRHYTEWARGWALLLVASEDGPRTKNGRLQEAGTWAIVI